MSDREDPTDEPTTGQPGSGVPGSGSVLRTALLVLLLYAVLGAVAGAVWELVWTPPTQIVQHHQVFYSDYASLRRVFTGTGLYVIVGGLASALGALAVTLLTRRRELLVLLLVVVGSALAAAVMWRVGTSLGPTDPSVVAAHAADGTTVSGQLQVSGRSPYLAWPMTSLFVLALVFFASPGASAGHRGRDGRHPDPREADVSGSTHR